MDAALGRLGRDHARLESNPPFTPATPNRSASVVRARHVPLTTTRREALERPRDRKRGSRCETGSRWGSIAKYDDAGRPRGLARGLTNYGDADFALYMRRSFATSKAMLPTIALGEVFHHVK